MRETSSGRRVLAARLAASAAVVVSPAMATSPAVAHPFGEPQTVTVAATEDGVRLEWRAEPDDVTALAAHLGVVRGTHVVVFEDGKYDAGRSSVPAGVRLAEEATVLEDYLLSRVQVRQGGQACEGSLAPVEDVEQSGAAVDFDCGGPVGSVEVTVGTLTDVDPRYRILASGPEGQRQVYTTEQDTFAWMLGDDPAPEADGSAMGRSAALQLGGIAGAGALAGGAGWWLLRRRARQS